MTKIIPQIVGRGAYGFLPRSPNVNTLKVWHVIDDYGQTVGTYRTRQEARLLAHMRRAIKKNYETYAAGLGND